MVVGIDVYTDRSSNNKITVTAFASSMNSNVTLLKDFCKTLVQKKLILPSVITEIL